MTLFIDHGDGFAPSCAFHDLFLISDTDDGLGDTPAGDPSVKKVTYTESAGVWATADRLNTLVNTDFGKPIVITACPSGVQNPYSGGVADITGNGETWQDNSSGQVVIRIVYDVGQCNASGIFVFDANGNQIPHPNEVMLYHELSHVFHFATNTVAATVALEEQAAETDENVLRDEEQLTERDVTNHDGGCGIDPAPAACTADDSSGDFIISCFIASAAAGSPYAEPVNRLRRARDLVVRRSSLVNRLFELAYGEYYSFSPDVAVEIASDAALARLVLTEVVSPLVEWYELLVVTCQGWSEPQLQMAAARLLATLKPTQTSAMAADFDGASPGERSQETPSGLAYLISRAEDAGAWTSLASWAALEPLVLLSEHVASGRSSDELLDAMARWLSQVPLPTTTLPVSRADLVREADELANIFTDLRFRHAVGAALLTHLEGSASFDVADVLTELGLLA